MAINKKLTEEQVIEICKKLNKGAFLKDLAEEFEVSLTTISLIANLKVHKKID